MRRKCVYRIVLHKIKKKKMQLFYNEQFMKLQNIMRKSIEIDNCQFERDLKEKRIL